MAEKSADIIRIQYGAWLIGAAFVLLTLVFFLALNEFETSEDVVAVVGAFTGVVGTVIGAFFGVQVGQAGKEAAEEGRAEAEKAARVYSTLLSPDRADDAARMLAE
jgi:hypothetical protein